MNNKEKNQQDQKKDNSTHPNPSVDAQKELAECKEKCLRLYAEFENARKRYERERFELIKYANEGLIAEFLGIIDDLERAVEAA